MAEPDIPQTLNPLADADINAAPLREPFPSTSLKRRASPSFEGLEEDLSRKRMKEKIETSAEDVGGTNIAPLSNMDSGLAEELAQELQCGCCSELVYRPVLVHPCQHFFCGSCCALWIRNGGTNCPACRGQSTVVTPFRALHSVIDTLLRAAPHKARTERERQQADEIYKVGTPLRIPPPREQSPEANVDGPSDYARPCPHCIAGNAYGWRCPQPIADPTTDLDRAWHLEDGVPPGHAHCGNCENLLATAAPTTTKCDLCQVFFCGIEVQGRCLATSILLQSPHGLTDMGDLIMSADVYECFDGNTIEVEFMLDYLRAQRLTPRHIYREVVIYIQSQPRGFRPLVELELFSDLHTVAAGTDPDPDAPRNNVCRQCAAEVFLWGIRDWWIHERQKAFLEGTIPHRKDCPEGRACDRQMDHPHAREFNHMFARFDQGQPETEPKHEGSESTTPPFSPNRQPNLNETIEPPTAPETSGFNLLNVLSREAVGSSSSAPEFTH